MHTPSSDSPPRAGREVDHLDKRIVAALQEDGRASWRRIAGALEEPVTTVARRGSALISDGVVRVAAVTSMHPSLLVSIECEPTRLVAVAQELAAHPDIVFLYALAGPSQLIAEMQRPENEFAALLMEELPAVQGVTRVDATPVLEYFRTVSEWHPNPLTEDERDRLAPMVANPASARRFDESLELSSTDDEILRLLVQDGRIPTAQLSALVELSEPAVRRRLNFLLTSGIASVRAIVEPRDVGFPIEAVLWVQVDADKVRTVGTEITEASGVRYAAMVMGQHQLIVNVTVASLFELRKFLTESPWVSSASSIRSSLVSRAFRRGGVTI